MKPVCYIVLFYTLLTVELQAEGRYAASSMELGVGARPLSLGGAAVALEGRGETFYYNPASLALLKKTFVNVMYAPTFGSLTDPMASYNYLGMAYPLPSGGTLSLNWTRFAVDDIPFYPELKGESFSERNKNLALRPDGTALGYFEDVEDVFYFSFANALEAILPLGWWYGDLPLTIPIGLNFKLLRQKLGDTKASGMGVDFGMMVKFHLGTLVNQRELGHLTFGLSLLDVTQTPIVWDTKHEDKVHATSVLGLAYDQPLWFADAVLSFYYSHYSKYDRQQLAGIEFAIKDIFVRIGKNDSGLTTGAGLCWGHFYVDYAFVSNNFKAVHRISCSISL